MPDVVALAFEAGAVTVTELADEALDAVVVRIKASPNILRDVIERFAHDPVIVEVFLAIHVIAGERAVKKRPRFSRPYIVSV